MKDECLPPSAFTTTPGNWQLPTGNRQPLIDNDRPPPYDRSVFVTVRSAVAALLESPDPAARDFSREGELLVARVRVVVCLLISLIPARSVIGNPASADNWIGLGCAFLAILFSGVVFVLAIRERPPRWLGLLTTQFDVAVVTLGLVGFLLAGHPLTATNSLIQYTVYFIAVGATCLRHDPRLCLLSGAAAMAQYGATVVWAERAGAVALSPDPGYGSFSWDAQIGRLILLGVAGGLNAIIVVRARAHWRNAIRDRLTGLYNRAFFEERLALAIIDARRAAQPLVVALADLDHFKALNDRHGHAAGDQALIRFAALMRQSFRPGDAPARHGGEEFAVMLPGAEPALAVARIEQLRIMLGSEPLLLSGGVRVSVTVSIGVALFPADGDTPAALVAAADTRLYEAKHAGRNQVVTPDISPSASADSVA
jgi:two-component system cell cycle response regulator